MRINDRRGIQFQFGRDEQIVALRIVAKIQMISMTIVQHAVKSGDKLILFGGNQSVIDQFREQIRQFDRTARRSARLPFVFVDELELKFLRVDFREVSIDLDLLVVNGPREIVLDRLDEDRRTIVGRVVVRRVGRRTFRHRAEAKSYRTDLKNNRNSSRENCEETKDSSTVEFVELSVTDANRVGRRSDGFGDTICLCLCVDASARDPSDRRLVALFSTERNRIETNASFEAFFSSSVERRRSSFEL